ncbi:MAG: hypothetical protein P9X22_00545 [Candidatus Zapsychrus exili]|nr:hypothetical protein [Candidatus Zapsychrus exili]
MAKVGKPDKRCKGLREKAKKEGVRISKGKFSSVASYHSPSKKKSS